MLECSTCRVKCLFRVSGCELPVVQSAFVNLPTGPHPRGFSHCTFSGLSLLVALSSPSQSGSRLDR